MIDTNEIEKALSVALKTIGVIAAATVLLVAVVAYNVGACRAPESIPCKCPKCCEACVCGDECGCAPGSKWRVYQPDGSAPLCQCFKSEVSK